jgi:NhaA family Na+:H+ antiporter
MSIFFFSIGLEIKKELFGGELSSFKKALLPVSAAVGGMVLPALFFICFTYGTNGAIGWGIPVATDIAFSLAILSLFGKRVPLAFKIFLVALAIVDDVGSLLIIAIFYTAQIEFLDLLYALIFFGILLMANFFRVRNVVFYAIVGIGGLWLTFFFSGIHPTIAGVLAAFTIPGRVKVGNKAFSLKMKKLLKSFKNTRHSKTEFITEEELHILEDIKKLSSDAETPLQKIEYLINPFVAYLILPLFALANSGVIISSNFLTLITKPIGLGIMTGLSIGKFLGVVLTVKLLVKLKLAVLPKSLSWKHIYGIGLLAGIGFTMSIFIAELAYASEEQILISKMSILFESICASTLAWIYLKFVCFREKDVS